MFGELARLRRPAVAVQISRRRDENERLFADFSRDERVGVDRPRSKGEVDLFSNQPRGHCVEIEGNLELGMGDEERREQRNEPMHGEARRRNHMNSSANRPLGRRHGGDRIADTFQELLRMRQERAPLRRQHEISRVAVDQAAPDRLFEA